MEVKAKILYLTKMVKWARKSETEVGMMLQIWRRSAN